MKGIWAERAEAAQAALGRYFWDETMKLFRPRFPDQPYQGPFLYWWQAHALDALNDFSQAYFQVLARGYGEQPRFRLGQGYLAALPKG
ncbi:hypothetical protein Mesil_3245 (plasmid) [Allomeiothermus silvanus DSM 9946]|jgi:predicted alpha-1,6-mannanase (GH76 family)|uniref:Uncharacterized protein n=1 Tax=Allomeiothermus silvanus (strain ATCC 700542 / DSM 9946 / NBRC 106475 / NCIMB 13440 / VI-R2) TaxID=526227 RepID=D7BIQ5_ALLS1|nr:hypothetical protein [Allomeiothermus silvanus]ADH65061.1 hypothetical protein Mesil_3245 [Allomeiothermus silvanus DSM 9946]